MLLSPPASRETINKLTVSLYPTLRRLPPSSLQVPTARPYGEETQCCSSPATSAGLLTAVASPRIGGRNPLHLVPAMSLPCRQHDGTLAYTAHNLTVSQ
ncbi:hypothetical protein E2C01_088059 [Portunus trituberculatus]|uniref:Uncharacterized protein n=1 Tax=Portunus trituberculatus TaxID=210409 RepID=A0A5B7JFP1_PORTR|nr:hypothetical protein [Portunus trituberculatus]